MRLREPLDDVFRSRGFVRVLRALHELPAGLAVSAREIARRAGISHPRASAVLASLVDQGVVLVRRAPRADAFELNRNHVLAEIVSPLFERERGIPEEFTTFLRTALERGSAVISAAFLFGSAARGEMAPVSDIDLAIISTPGKVEEAERVAAEVAEAVRRRFGSRLSVVIGTSSLRRLSAPGRPGHRLWARVAREGIPLMGGVRAAGA